ncbi:TolC family protein [Nitrospira sp. NS4]|uniref:TolC family protein n=1 Tax=Nitrospira sp. NS4 TaxID=3414498 RepID=UPI003C2F2527
MAKRCNRLITTFQTEKQPGRKCNVPTRKGRGSETFLMRAVMHTLLTRIIVLALVVGSPHLGVAQAGAQSSQAKPTVSRAVEKPASSLLTLTEAIRTGLANHPLLERSRYSALIAKALTRQTQGERYPWLEASIAGSSGSLRIITTDGKTIHDRGGHGLDPGGALPKHNQNMLTGGFLLNQLISDFGYTAHRILATEANEAASDKEILTNKAFVILNVQRAYLNTLLQQSLVTIATETVKQRQAVRDQVQALYKHQLKSKVDLDLVLVEVANAELSLIKAKNDLKQSFATLNNAMGSDGQDQYELEPIRIQVTPSESVETLVTTGLNDRPELLGNRDRLVASEELLRAVKALNYGSLTAVGSVGITQYGDVHDAGIPSDAVAPFWGFGITIKFPLFTGFRIQSQIKEAGHRKGETDEELQALANEIILQIVRAYLTRTTNAEQIALEQERVTFSKEALLLAQERYRLGLSPIVEVVRATAVLFESESRLAESRYIYKISESVVSYATGQEYKRF